MFNSFPYSNFHPIPHIGFKSWCFCNKTMKSWHFILLSCLFTAVLYLFSPYNQFPNLSSSSSSSSIFLTGRRSVRELKMSLPDHKNRLPEAKGLVDEALQSLEKGSNAVIDSRRHSNSNNMDELVYHIDYHGVTTHPTPTPKHPKP